MEEAHVRLCVYVCKKKKTKQAVNETKEEEETSFDPSILWKNLFFCRLSVSRNFQEVLKAKFWEMPDKLEPLKYCHP